MRIEVGFEDSREVAIYRAATARTHGLIDPAPDHHGGLTAIHARARAKLERTARLLALMGDPHRVAPVIHVGGTSGKGSTAVAIAAVLTAAGYRTLLHTSPYLQVATEKLQVDGQLVAVDVYAAGVGAVLAAGEALGEGPITYAELWMALIGWTMRELAVDAAVIEVGAGGRLDTTNVVWPAVSVITSVGLDHTETLGPTIAEIAWQKAGIIKAGAPVVTAVDDPLALAVIRAESELRGVEMTTVEMGRDVVVGGGDEPRVQPVRWQDVATGEWYTGGMAGAIQALNGATALGAVRALRHAGWRIDDAAVRTGLASGRLPGRLEVMAQRPLVVLDGAHNPQKAAALARDLARMGRRCVGVVGVLAAKQAREVLTELAPTLSVLVATAPAVYGKASLSAAALARIAVAVGIPEVHVADDPLTALDRALAMAGPDDVVLVTGSLYLIGDLRRRWHMDAAILTTRTPWPDAYVGRSG